MINHQISRIYLLIDAMAAMGGWRDRVHHHSYTQIQSFKLGAGPACYVCLIIIIDR